LSVFIPGKAGYFQVSVWKPALAPKPGFYFSFDELNVFIRVMYKYASYSQSMKDDIPPPRDDLVRTLNQLLDTEGALVDLLYKIVHEDLKTFSSLEKYQSDLEEVRIMIELFKMQIPGANIEK
jgi:hypothetical protein